MRYKGNIKFYLSEKGFGFITPSNYEAPDGKDLFFHVSTVPVELEEFLQIGKPVSFEVVEKKNGYHAINIELC